MTQRGRNVGGRFQSATATRTVVDEHLAATTEELPDGTILLSSGPSIVEHADGSRTITAAEGASVKEDRALTEPVIFTNPTQPNMTLAGTLYKIGPGQWKQLPHGKYLRFINGHCAAHTEQEQDKVLSHFSKGKKKLIWEEPAPLLSEEKAAARGLEPPFLFENTKGQILFWTYHRDAYQQFIRTFNAHAGI